MPLTIVEGLQDIPMLVDFVTKVEAAIKALPPVASRKLSDYCNAAGAILVAAGPLADTVEAQAQS